MEFWSAPTFHASAPGFKWSEKELKNTHAYNLLDCCQEDMQHHYGTRVQEVDRALVGLQGLLPYDYHSRRGQAAGKSAALPPDSLLPSLSALLLSPHRARPDNITVLSVLDCRDRNKKHHQETSCLLRRSREVLGYLQARLPMRMRPPGKERLCPGYWRPRRGCPATSRGHYRIRRLSLRSTPSSSPGEGKYSSFAVAHFSS